MEQEDFKHICNIEKLGHRLTIKKEVLQQLNLYRIKQMNARNMIMKKFKQQCDEDSQFYGYSCIASTAENTVPLPRKEIVSPDEKHYESSPINIGPRVEVSDIEIKRCQTSHHIPLYHNPLSSDNKGMSPEESGKTMSYSSFSCERP